MPRLAVIELTHSPGRGEEEHDHDDHGKNCVSVAGSTSALSPPRLEAAIVITTAARFHMVTRSGHQLACLSVCLVALSVSGSAVLLTPHSVAARMSKSNEEHEIAAAAAAAPRYMSTSM